MLQSVNSSIFLKSWTKCSGQGNLESLPDSTEHCEYREEYRGRTCNSWIGFSGTDHRDTRRHIRWRVLMKQGTNGSPTYRNRKRRHPPDPVASTLRRARHFINTRLLLRARTLFLVPIPLFFMGLWSTFSGEALEMLGRFGGFSLFMVAAWMLIQGQKAQHAYEARAVAKPPAIPRKLFASLLTGSAVAVTSLFGFTPIMNDPASAAIFSLMAILMHSISFGLDPMRAKGLKGYSEYDANRLLEALEKGERLLDETLTASSRLPDRSLQHHVERLVDEARQMFRAIEQDPRDLSRARKFMSVYLQGTRDATVKLARLSAKDRNTTASHEYQQLLYDLEDRFIRQKESLMLNDRTDLDVEVEVLRERLNQE